MSFRGLLIRTVDVVPMNAAAEDRYGNETIGPGETIVGVPARRQQVGADEEITNRDQQARTFLYFLPLELDDGTPLEISGRDRIIDGDETLEVIGTPDRVDGRVAGHHYEARALLVNG